MKATKVLDMIKELNEREWVIPEFGAGYKFALMEVLKTVTKDIENGKTEGQKLDELGCLLIQLNPSQETCKKLIEFVSEFMVRKSQMHELLDPLRRIQ